MLEMSSIHPYRCKSKVVGFTDQDDDVCFQSLEILHEIHIAKCLMLINRRGRLLSLDCRCDLGEEPWDCTLCILCFMLAGWWAVKGRTKWPL